MRHVIYLLKVAILFTVYFLTAKYGLKIGAVSGFATLVWLPTGISLSALFIFGYSLWPAITAGAFLINFLTGAPFPVAAGIAVGNTLETLVAIYIFKKLIKETINLNRLHDVLTLLLVSAPVGTIISASIGVSCLWLGGLVSDQMFIPTWTAWWVGNMISSFVIAPLLLVWVKSPSIKIDPRKTMETVALFFTVCLVGFIVFRGSNYDQDVRPLTYLVFPPLIWAALRFSQRETITAAFLFSILAVISTLQGFGPFSQGHINKDLLHLQSYMSVIAITSLLLAAAINERKYLENQKDIFLGIASHELKTPITSIKGYAQAIHKNLNAKGDVTTALALSKMISQINKLTSLISDLLDITKIETGKLQFNIQKVHFKTLLDESVEAMQLVTKKHKIIMQGNSDIEIYADKDRIGQVLANLLSNAIKYSPKGDQIIINTSLENDKVVCSVKDFGVGIAKEKQSRIFERFFREDGLKEDVFPGLGIGLYISSEIIKRHNGKIWLESEKDQGAIFYISLPISPV